jgi:hypothetical protein
MHEVSGKAPEVPDSEEVELLIPHSIIETTKASTYLQSCGFDADVSRVVPVINRKPRTFTRGI